MRKDYLVRIGVVPQENIVKVEDGRDTLYEAFSARKTARQLNLKSILLVTSDKHMERALYMFKNIFGDKFEIEGETVPCGNLLNPAEEKEYLSLAKKLFSKFTGDIPEPKDWETWFDENKWFYQESSEIHKKYIPNGLETNQAYMGTKSKEI